ncbi:MAG: very short patch repair endonuclease [Paracoccaceae bacterium]
MVDIVDARTRSQMMSNIRGKDTKPELTLRRALHARGFRFRLHVKDVPGRPDIVFPKYRAVVFVHGCFWHRHAGCRYATVLGTACGCWRRRKFAANVSRDAAVHDKPGRGGELQPFGECAAGLKALTQTAEIIGNWLKSDRPEMELGELQVEPH